ncbi:transmembrane protein, putative (macronuclear) [Tetrahymena thermophila SB210]|uniref:Transmembrane protein, putative n=1 Tax=Tetrahymena thermophila (strain SB210) TaxID=312017 RepID=W7XHM2_TETTS|nr:transmembrane protein, putative [Tetrahymena thermophila SB210]EWS72624.1 transmembrane protein, putative [Tetrahymena thermophila SB210]|eukprot:XP_012654907.1 transmembrane protein, putative [Tetrahymena thermophila SB210]
MLYSQIINLNILSTAKRRNYIFLVILNPFQIIIFLIKLFFFKKVFKPTIKNLSIQYIISATHILVKSLFSFLEDVIPKVYINLVWIFYLRYKFVDNIQQILIFKFRKFVHQTFYFARQMFVVFNLTYEMNILNTTQQNKFVLKILFHSRQKHHLR